MLGWYMVEIPRGTPPRGLYFNLHKSVGLILSGYVEANFNKYGVRFFGLALRPWALIPVKPDAGRPGHTAGWSHRMERSDVRCKLLGYRVAARRLGGHGSLATCKSASIAGHRPGWAGGRFQPGGAVACSAGGVHAERHRARHPDAEVPVAGVEVRLHGVRQDAPPKMARIDSE